MPPGARWATSSGSTLALSATSPPQCWGHTCSQRCPVRHPPLNHGAGSIHTALLACEMSLRRRMRTVTVRNWAVQPRYHRTVVRLEDGGTIGLDWFRWRECAARLPAAAPLLMVAHPITGGLPLRDSQHYLQLITAKNKKKNHVLIYTFYNVTIIICDIFSYISHQYFTTNVLMMNLREQPGTWSTI